MKPTPNQLALLISLIGVGVAAPARAMSAASVLVDEFGTVATASVVVRPAQAKLPVPDIAPSAVAPAQAAAGADIGVEPGFSLDLDAGPIVLTVLPAAPVADNDAVMRSLAAVLMAEPPSGRAPAARTERIAVAPAATNTFDAPAATASSPPLAQIAPAHTARVKLAPRNVLEPAARGVVDEYSDVLAVLEAVLSPGWTGPVYADVSVHAADAPAAHRQDAGKASRPTLLTRVQLTPSVAPDSPAADPAPDAHAQVLQLLAAVLTPGWTGPTHAAAAPLADEAAETPAMVAVAPAATPVLPPAAAEVTAPAATAASDATPAAAPVARVAMLDVDIALHPAHDIATEAITNLAAFGLQDLDIPAALPAAAPQQPLPRVARLDVDLGALAAGAPADAASLDVDLSQPTFAAQSLAVVAEPPVAAPPAMPAQALVASPEQSKADPVSRRADLSAPSPAIAHALIDVSEPLVAMRTDGSRGPSDQVLSILEEVLSPAWAGPSHVAAGARPARDAGPAPRPFGNEVLAVAESQLGDVRGGFTTPDGLQVSFGIERAVYINGSLVTTTSLNLSELGKITGGAGAAATLPGGAMTIIQNGPGNTFQTGPVSAGTLGTVIQNTLNDQKIESVTVINATVNSLGIAKSMSNAAALRGAMVDTLRR